MIVHLIRNNDPKVDILKYKINQYWLEKALRGKYADLILVHGLEIEDISDKLMFTLKACISLRRGAIIFMDDCMERLLR